MDIVRALRITTLRAVAEEDLDEEAQWRAVARWFSREFSTPLKEVDELPKLDVIRHYLEDSYLKMEPHELQQEIDNVLSEKGFESKLEKAKKDADDDKFAQEIEKEAQAVNLKSVKLLKKDEKKTNQVDPRILAALESLGESIGSLTPEKKQEEGLSDFGLDASMDGEESS